MTLNIDLPKAIINSDDELMGIQIIYSRHKDRWFITYSDEGSSMSADGRTLEDAIKAIRKEHKRIYHCEIEENS
jgi:hypothetical protein